MKAPKKSMTERTPKGSSVKHTLLKEYWRPLKSGGKVCDYVIDCTGDDLVRPALLEEIVPNEQYYMQGVFKTGEFTPTTFHHSVSWDTVQEIFKTGRIYIRHGNERQISKDEGTLL